MAEKTEETKKDPVKTGIQKAIAGKDTKALSKYRDHIEKDDEGKYYYEDDNGEKTYLATNDVPDKKIKQMLIQIKDSSEHFNYEDVFYKLGKVAVLRGASSLIGLEQKPEALLSKISDTNYDDVYDIAFEDNKNIKAGMFKGKSLNDVLKACARRKAVEDLKTAEKIDGTTYEKLVKAGDDEYKEYSEDIATDAATKNKYNAVKNELESAFEKGVKETRKELDEGQNIKEPFTNRTLNLEDGKVKKALKGAAKNAAKKIGEILGISENSPDIFSKLIFAAIGGGNKLWKNIQKKRALARFNDYKKVTVKSLKKEIDDAIKEAKPLLSNGPTNSGESDGGTESKPGEAEGNH